MRLQQHRRFLRGIAVVLGCASTHALAADVTASRYVVRFDEPSLGRYNSVAPSMAAPPAGLIPVGRKANGRDRLDVSGPAANSYVAYLRGRQDKHLGDIAAAIGRVPVMVHSMRHALDAAILILSPAEAQRIARTPGVAAVDPDRKLDLTSDIGPGFTGAASVWWGATAGQDSLFAGGFDNTDAYRGDGVVIGMIDTGYNSLSPSFQAIDSSGYRIVNPLGHNVFLGQCMVPAISLGGCNDKVIGVYDEADLTAGAGAPVFSVEDVQGHGSHTASTAAGDERAAVLDDYSVPLAGVAPHANLVIFRACTPNTGCAYSAILGAIDQAIADGVVDVLNFSISDAAPPWTDPIAQAFLAATEAGIFVSAAAGNICSFEPSQVAGSAMNLAPWIATVGAGTHTGGDFGVDGRAVSQPDELTTFSLLGPANFDAIKPDLQAPGAHIIAATSNDGSASGPVRVAMMNGTSMAAAHLSGSAALMLGMHPDWTPHEAKSAIMMTAKESALTKSDGTTPSDYFDRGSGRVREFAASSAGLVMDETGNNFTAADPTWGLGDPGSLNLASMQRASCAGACSFTRQFRSTQDHKVTWTASIGAVPNSIPPSVSVVPSSFAVSAYANSKQISISVATGSLAADGSYHYAEVVLTPDDRSLVPLHLTLAVAVPRA
jgi:hypothetical protein